MFHAVHLAGLSIREMQSYSNAGRSRVKRRGTKAPKEEGATKKAEQFSAVVRASSGHQNCRQEPLLIIKAGGI